MMMNAVDEDAEMPQHPEELATTTKADDESTTNQLDEAAPVGRRDRKQSDTARRADRETQRAALREHKSRLSVLNNRFLTSRKESRATSGGDAKSSSGSPLKTQSSPHKKAKKKPKKTRAPEPQDDGENEYEDDVKEKQKRQVIEESALVVTRKRSSAVSSSAGKNEQPMNRRDSRSGASPRRLEAKDVVVTPSVHVIPSLALKRSKWTRELDEDAACGLFVGDERRELSQVASSTLVRLEERLSREGKDAHAAVRLNDLLYVPQLQDRFVGGVCDAISTKDLPPVRRQRPMWTTATLAITIDRLVLDDHVSFSLADRLETQLRSLCVSYTHLLHAQPWAPLLQRIDAFVDASLQHRDSEKPQQWMAQTQMDVETLLQSLSTLQQLHYQLLAKWHELQDCYRQPTLPTRPTKLRLRHAKRAASVGLTCVRAFLELESAADEMQESREKLEKRLDEQETKDQHLHTVLTLETEVSGTSGNAGVATIKSSRRWSIGWRAPTFYVALFINDKEVGRTKANDWIPKTARDKSHVGVISILETLETQLHFFPDSVAIKVFERGLVTDTLLSTTSIPLLVPGHDRASTGSLSEPSNRVAAASLAPSIEWYQFSSIHAMPRSRWHATFLNSPLFATFQRHPHGRVRAHVSWVAPEAHDNQRDEDEHLDQPIEVVLPARRLPVATRDNTKLIGPRVDRRRLYHTPHDDERFGRRRADAQRAGFSYERDFLVHMADSEHDPQLIVDRNDPQNAAVVRLQDHVRTHSTLLKERGVFRATSLVYDATPLLPTLPVNEGRARLTRRNLLLQLRDREHTAKHGTSMILADAIDDFPAKKWDHNAFDEPLPLSEHAIASNAKFLTLLRPELPAFDYRQRLDDALAVDGSARFSLERERKLQQLKLQDFVDRVRASQVARAHNKAAASAGKHRDRTKTLATIIQEQPMPLLPGVIDFSGMANIFSRRRRLRPRVEVRSAPATMADWPRHCMLYVQIKSATNVPERATAERSAKPPMPKKRDDGKRRRSAGAEGDDDDDEAREPPKENQETGSPAAESSHVFVEVSFQGRRRRTTSTHVRATGAVWMETVALPFNAPREDWSPDSLVQSPDVVHLSLFDQLVRTSSTEGSDDALLMLHRKSSDADETLDDHIQQQRIQSFHQENRYLGSLEIPFTTLYLNHGTLDATLRCEMPVANVGYVNAKQSGAAEANDVGAGARAGTAADREDDGVVQSSREATFLSVMMTLDPLLPMPVQSFEENALSASDDYAALAAYATEWKTTTRDLNAATQQRDFHVFVRSLGHGQTFLPRYVTPQMPPALLEASGSRLKPMTITQAVRFVRLIPYLDDWQLFDDGGELDVWTTSQELLDLNAGDLEEHAVLLCNFFNWFDRDEANRKSFLVLGTAVPEGKTVYVLRQDSYKIPQRSVLWNAVAGVGYSVLDDRCPVLDVSLVVSTDNIYANIQPRKRLSEMNWDIETNAKAWKPFFHGSRKKEHFTLPSVQATQLVYAETPSDYVQQVEVELREALKLEIRRWRSIKHTTTYNMDLSMKLRAQLERLELAMLHGPSDAIQKTKDPLLELQKSRRVSGMPLNTTFTDTNKVIAMVKNTNIYWNDQDAVEFGLAVYVHAYPNCVLSVWVYLVAVEPIE